MKAFTGVVNIYININMMKIFSRDNTKSERLGTEKEAYRHKNTNISANKHVVLIIHASTVL